MNDRVREMFFEYGGLKDWVIACGVLALAIVLIVVAGVFITRVEAVGDMDAIEQLRQDVRVVQPTEAHDVIGKAVETNMMIASHKAYAEHWYFWPFVSGRYKTVEYIAIDREVQ